MTMSTNTRDPDPVDDLPLVEELLPAPSPEEAFERLLHLPMLLFLDSTQVDAELGRYTFIAGDPFEAVFWKQGKLWPGRGATVPAAAAVACDPFPYLKGRLACFPAGTIPGLPPFQGGLGGLFSYDLCHVVEKLPRPRHNEFQLPEMALGFYDWVVAFDLRQQRAWLISQGFPETQKEKRLRRAQARRDEVRAWLDQSTPAGQAESEAPTQALPASALAPQWPAPGPPGLTSNFSHGDYLRAVEKTIEYIRAGDMFQANLSQRLLFPARIAPAQLYRRLRQLNHAAFSAYFNPGGLVIASASPERFLEVRGDEVETRPIKGTRPRGLAPHEDNALVEELRTSEKDRAENIMIVDLLRNDLSRVCLPGSVKVQELCRLETTRFVHHLVSVIRGRLRPGQTALDLLRASFPGGSITGAPKVRAMEIIAELEPTARGPYCGCLGYLGFDGGMDTSILIRTITAARGWLQLPVGGGIVAQSVPQKEYEETLHKAQGLLRAL